MTSLPVAQNKNGSEESAPTEYQILAGADSFPAVTNVKPAFPVRLYEANLSTLQCDIPGL
jgi:hypothetical protein